MIKKSNNFFLLISSGDGKGKEGKPEGSPILTGEEAKKLYNNHDFKGQSKGYFENQYGSLTAFQVDGKFALSSNFMNKKEAEEWIKNQNPVDEFNDFDDIPFA